MTHVAAVLNISLLIIYLQFKFLNLSTIFREDFPSTRAAQIGSEFDYNPSSPRGKCFVSHFVCKTCMSK